MNSPSARSSPTFKNLNLKQKQSPKELKEKMRKDYKHKVHNCRNLLLNRFRGSVDGIDLRTTLTEIYKSMFNFTGEHASDNEEYDALEEIKNELIEEELEWWLEEYEKSQMENVDWSLQQEENVICPVCQKNNLIIENGCVNCLCCKISIKTEMTLIDIKKKFFCVVEKHSADCSFEGQFTAVPECNENHIYYICSNCTDMQLIL